MKKLSIGILAHVDAGKTTLSEAILYLCGKIKSLGRVDHKNTFFDNFELEKSRGITIFSKYTFFNWKNTSFTLIDTPGHVDFSPEMERTLQILDAAILIISATDGIQSHTKTLWQLLEQNKIPTLIFINKIDLPNNGKISLINEIKKNFNDNCIDFKCDKQTFFEQIAVCSENLLEKYLNNKEISKNDISQLIHKRQIFPCFFGCALHSQDDIKNILNCLDEYFLEPIHDKDFGAIVFKITRDNAGNRLTHMKITSGSLSVRTLIKDNDWQEKITQIRIYEGNKYKTCDIVYAGQICAVTGLSKALSGDGLGTQNKNHFKNIINPVLRYRVCGNHNSHTVLKCLKQLEEEDPTLKITWDNKLNEIYVNLMGNVQIEILTDIIKTRFGLNINFDEGNILYYETIKSKVVGVGHFEPLKHYAEVHLLIEPLPCGSGIQIDNICLTDELDTNWQKLILSHIIQENHTGVLTNSPITDVKITLICGKAHLKHTEGGDFRQATCRAIRQGLMKAQSILLEPYYSFKIEVENDKVGKVMTDIKRMNGEFNSPICNGETSILTGDAPVYTMIKYPLELTSYTNGKGKIFLNIKGYFPCHNADDIIKQKNYNPENDPKNTPDSIFCSHGAGFNVKWNEVYKYQHLHPQIEKTNNILYTNKIQYPSNNKTTNEKEIEEIFIKTYGPIKNRSYDAFKSSKKAPKRTELCDETLSRIKPDDYLLVDGYNIIFSWDELNEISKDDLSAARSSLIRILSNFQGMKKCKIILVFDAYNVSGNGSIEKDGNIDIVYTKEAETADMYIEKLSYDLSRKHRVRVATSDAIEQMIIIGHGAERLSSNDLKWEIEQTQSEIEKIIKNLEK